MLACAVLGLASACGGSETSTGTTPSPPQPLPTDTVPAPATATVRVYLARDEVIGPVARQVEAPAVLRGALEQLLREPSETERGWGFSTAVPSGVTLRDVAVADGTATIDLSAEFASGGGSAGMFLRLAQLVATATQFDTVDRVALRLDGEPVTTFSSEGIELPPTLTRKDIEEQLPAILVESPLPGQKLAGPVTVSGTANTFEATVEWELRQFEGDKLDGGFTTATCGTGCRGSFSFQVPKGASGSLSLRVFERSAKDGSVTKLVTIPLTLA